MVEKTALDIKAEQRRQQHLDADEILMQNAKDGPSETSSGMRGERNALPKRRKSSRKTKVMAAQEAIAPMPGFESLAPSEQAKKSRIEATRAADTFMREQEVERREKVRKRDEDAMSYVRCHVCQRPGIFIHNARESMVDANGNSDWSSSYKPRGQVWPSQNVPCQCCLMFNKRTVNLKMKVAIGGGGKVMSIRPFHRMVVPMSTKEFNRLIGQSAK